jgi:hypothetical protein
MTLCGEQHRRWKRHFHWYGRNAGDAEDGIQQRAIFGAKARNFVLLRGDRGALLIVFSTLPRDFSALACDFGALPGDFGFEGARVRCGSDSAPDFVQGYLQGQFLLYATRRIRVIVFGVMLGDSSIEERFLDCVSRRFAQKQKRETLRSE